MRGKVILRRVLTFFLFGLVNSFVFTAVNNLAPNFLVLGNTFLTAGAAAFLGGFVLAGILALVEPMFELLHIHVKHDLSWALLFLIINTESIWALGRLANYTGIGLAAFWVAFELGLVVNLLQWGIWKGVVKLVR